MRPPVDPVGLHHIPVLYHEVLAGLQPHPGGFYIDGTLGAGGHAVGLLEGSNPDGRLLGMDVDPAALEAARARLAEFGERAQVVQASYCRMAAYAPAASADGILLDLGLSSLQTDDPERGFSFQSDGPLDMRFNPQATLTAAEIVNEWAPEELANLLFEYGQERHSRRIARAIVAARPVRGTRELAEVVSRAVGGRREKIHPATRAFQALRIAVNGELEAVAEVLPIAVSLLKTGGRLAVISFHSLEDRIVKQFFRHAVGRQEAASSVPELRAPPMPPSAPTVRAITRKPIGPSPAETAANPRSRSAKLRVVEKLPPAERP